MSIRALDLFCKAGGASRGLQLAGFRVTGVDIEAQPRYCGDEFYQADALEFDLDGFDFIWASPPCQKYTRMARGLLQSQGRAREYVDLVSSVRSRLQASGKPYVIENVIGAPLVHPVMLCGSSFGLDVERHRIFESSFPMLTPACRHWAQVKDKPGLSRLNGVSRVVGCYGNGRGKGDTVGAWRKAMQIDWMSRAELAQAIPPAYSHFIAQQFLQAVQA